MLEAITKQDAAGKRCGGGEGGSCHFQNGRTGSWGRAAPALPAAGEGEAPLSAAEGTAAARPEHTPPPAAAPQEPAVPPGRRSSPPPGAGGRGINPPVRVGGGVGGEGQLRGRKKVRKMDVYEWLLLFLLLF